VASDRTSRLMVTVVNAWGAQARLTHRAVAYVPCRGLDVRPLRCRYRIEVEIPDLRGS